MVYNLASDVKNVRKGHKLKDIPAHDPFIVTDSITQTYYLYTTGIPELTGLERCGVLMYKSRNLIEWEGPFTVFEVPDNIWAHPMHGTWAPEVHGYKGKYYLFVTLHNRNETLEVSPKVWHTTHLRGTSIAVSNTPEGPFEIIKKDAPVTPKEFMALDGTLYIDKHRKPWMVYCHEWIQVLDGTFEAIPLKSDLSAADGEPIHLFKASDAPWINEKKKPSVKPAVYVSDGCQLYRTQNDSLYCLWSSYENDSYVQTIARSKSGELKGPWEQLEPLVGSDSGHGMLFKTFEKQWMLVLHQPFSTPESRAKIYEMEEVDNQFKVKYERMDLNGETK